MEPFPAYPGGNSWDEAFGKMGSGQKFHLNVILGADFVYATARGQTRSIQVGSGDTSEEPWTVQLVQLVDCMMVDSSVYDKFMDNAFIFTKKNATHSEGSYHYTSQDGICSLSGCRVDILHGGVGRVHRRVH